MDPESVDPESVAQWAARDLKRFLKDRNLPVKQYKDKAHLVDDVLGVMQSEREVQYAQEVFWAVVVVILSLCVYRLMRKYRVQLLDAVLLNPWWIFYSILERLLQYVSYLNVISVVSSWILPARWNLVRVYFWDYILPDFGYAPSATYLWVGFCARLHLMFALCGHLNCLCRTVPVPLPSMGGGGTQPQNAPASMGINIMPIVVGWAIRKAQYEVLMRKSVTSMYRDGVSTRARREGSSSRRGRDRAKRVDGGHDAASEDDPSAGGGWPKEQVDDDDVVFLRSNQNDASRPVDDDEFELRKEASKRQEADVTEID